jgi:hypothetical protein
MIFMQTPLEWTMSDAPDAYRTDLGGRVEVYGASPVLWSFARLFASGGPQVFYSAAGVSAAKPIVGGGGQVGMEVFLDPGASLFAEIGATSGLQSGWGAGGTAMLGVTFYPWNEGQSVVLVGSAK